MPYKGEVQLLPESERRPTLSSYTSGNSYFYAALVTLILALVATAILATYKKSLTDAIDDVRSKIVAGDESRNRKQEQELIAASKQSKIMSQLLESKLYWSQALTKLEKMTQTSVQYSSINANAEKGTIDFKASADSYTTVARQLASFTNSADIKDFTLGKLEATTSGQIEFTGQLLIDTKEMLLKKNVPTKP
ncbi:MAG: hypothetical protein KBC02_02970 [Candidatus Pacebacteria bacterium]|nr:hypothetical protein [Candidatus Paceibacterota bacterium]